MANGELHTVSMPKLGVSVRGKAIHIQWGREMSRLRLELAWIRDTLTAN